MTGRARIYRAAPGRWRCELPDLDGAVFAPSWPLALQLACSLTELAAAHHTVTQPATDDGVIA